MPAVQDTPIVNPKTDSIANPFHPSVSAIICSMQVEIDALTQQKAELERGLRKLYGRLRALRAAKGDAPQEKPAPAQLRRSGRRLRKALRLPATDKAQKLYEELRRACRIALLEAEGPTTPDQIHRSIIRRGSFAFEVLDEEPITAILRVLNLIGERTEADWLTSAPALAGDVHPGSIDIFPRDRLRAD